MKRGLFLALIATIALSGMTTAQNEQPKGERKAQLTAEQMAQQITDKQTKELSLDAEQSKKLYEANLQQAQSQKQMREAKHDFDEQQRAEMQQQREALDNTMREILTPEQYAKWEAAEKSHRPHDNVKGGPHKGYDGKPMGCNGKKCGDKGRKQKNAGSLTE